MFRSRKKYRTWGELLAERCAFWLRVLQVVALMCLLLIFIEPKHILAGFIVDPHRFDKWAGFARPQGVEAEEVRQGTYRTAFFVYHFRQKWRQVDEMHRRLELVSLDVRPRWLSLGLYLGLLVAVPQYFRSRLKRYLREIRAGRRD